MRYLVLAILVLAASSAFAQVAGPSAQAQRTPRFVVFDGLLNPDKPDLRKLGMPELRGSANIWRPGIPHDTVDARGVASMAGFLSTFGDAFYLDVEVWPLYNVPPEVQQANLAKLIRVAQITRETAPQHRFGYYGLLPHRTYWPFILRREADIAVWRESNELSAPLAEYVDFVSPSLYTFYDDPEGWKVAALEILSAAKRYGKPVYPFLWPEYHDSTKLAGQPVAGPYWRMQLDFVREHADGVVLWGGHLRKWDENAEWWVETKSFLKTLD